MDTTRPETVGLSSARLARVERAVQKHIAANHIAGAVTLVVRRDQVVHYQALGLMDVETQEPMRLDTLFRIYSMTKPLTSVALMMLYEEGLLHLTDPVARYIPAFEDLCVFVRETEGGVELARLERPVTVHHLLTHTAGLGYGLAGDDYVNALFDKRVWKPWNENRDITLQELVDNVCQCPLLFQPGAKWSYSIASDVLGYLVQVVSGQPFDRFLQERILEPLGMVDTAFHVPGGKLGRFATCYQPDGAGGIQVQDAPATSRFAAPTRCPAGGMGLISTAADYYRFAHMLRNKGELDGERLLGRKTVELMAANHLRDGIYRDGDPALGFGLGFGVTIDAARTKRLGSTGTYGWGGAATTRFAVDPQEDLVYVLMTQLMYNLDCPIIDDVEVAIYQALVD